MRYSFYYSEDELRVFEVESYPSEPDYSLEPIICFYKEGEIKFWNVFIGGYDLCCLIALAEEYFNE